ncbi:hypothetical protein [Effusibacillus dendaii]|uniref:Uncharacterized protein n=1 Tax=Effusibacillus dendaii TaxID=2743772 RepID=A0A7I8D8Q7_9BACL|nr:hypothetical protein [Effusibacillus dendaii]BCJ86528.1 hypothetical protein skT53_15130 [Effusibacillus dendaii]
MHMWVIALLILQLLLIVGLVTYFKQNGSWNEEVKYTILEEEQTDPEVVDNPYRKVWREYLSSRE